MEEQFMQSFWSLSSVEEEERLEAGEAILTFLKQQQQAVDSPEEGVSSELQYAVQRLVKGLSSNRKGARHGFYTVLTQVLAQYPQVTVVKVLKLVHTHLEPRGGTKAAEERGMCFGKGFALLSLVCSGVLATKEDFVSVAEQLVALGKKKSFLREFCGSVMCQLLSVCPVEMCRDHVMGTLELNTGWQDCIPEKLYVLLHLSSLYSKEKWFRVFLQQHWSSKHVWSRKNFSQMAGVLLESSSSLPRLHSVWPLILGAVRCEGHFREFWNAVVDDGLMLSSHERKYVGFQLCEFLLPSLSAHEVGVVFSPNLLACLMNNSHSTKNYLYSAARHLLGEMCSSVAAMTDQQLLVSLLVHLQRKTNSKFDSLMGSKVIETIYSKLDEGGVGHLLAMLQEILARADEDGAGDERHEEQVWAVEQVLGMVRNPRLVRKGPWLISAATLLLGHAFFAITPPVKELPCPLTPTATPLEPSVRESCQQRFMSILTDLSNTSLRIVEEEGGAGGPRPHYSRPGLLESGEHFLTAILRTSRQLMATQGVRTLHPFNDKEQAAWDSVWRLVEELSAKESLEAEEKAFLYLLSLCGLELLPPAAGERGHVCKTVSELEACHGEMEAELASKRGGRTPRKKKQSHEETKWMCVLTDVMLGLLSQPSQLWRTLVEQAFRLLTGHVSEECLQLILAVLKPKQELEEVMEEGEEEEEEEEEGAATSGEEGVNESSASEEGEEEEEEEEGAATSGEEGVNESSASEEGEEEEGVDPVFTAEVRRALGTAAASDGESEESLDDEAMMSVDKALGQVFRTHLRAKHQKKDDEKSLMHFKLRVLDLVELFVQRECGKPLVLDLLLPLHEVVQSSQSSKAHTPLVERAGSILTNRLCHAKTYPKSGLDVASVHDKLHELVQSLYKSTPTTSPLAIAGCMFLIRVLRGCVRPPLISPLTTRAGRKRKVQEGEEQGVGPGSTHGQLDVGVVTGWFSEALHDFVTVKNSSIPPAVFTTYIQRYPELAGLLVPTMLQDLPSAANHFKKTQVCEMLAVILSGLEEEAGQEVWSKLSPVDAEAVHGVMEKGKSKRSRRRKSKKLQNLTACED